MQGTSTQQELIKFLYHETDPTETAAIEEALDLNWNLRETVAGFSEVKQLLDKGKRYRPSQQCIESIMAYSAQTAALQEHTCQ